MQLREEIRTANTVECPSNDWLCRYFENGGCSLKDKDKCSSWVAHARKIKKMDK